MIPKGFIPPHELSALDPSTPILVALSGGPDSAALIAILAEYRNAHGTPIYAAHVDHLIRANEHERDRDHCIALCQKLGVNLFVKTVDIPKLAKESGESIELCARRIRYDFFAELMSQHSIPLLATAHNADDNLETQLMSLIRGSGLRGICGIPQCRKVEGGILIRPILSMQKAEILNFCRENQIDYVIDSTNSLPDGTRNRLRLEVVPILKDINPSAVKNSTRLSSAAREDEALLQSLADKLVVDSSITLSDFCAAPTPLRVRALFTLFGRELEEVHISALIRLCNAGQPHSELSLPSGITAVIENGRLMKKADDLLVEPYELPIFSGKNRISERLLLLVSDNDTIINSSETAVSLASDKIIGGLTARNRRPGDTIVLHGHHRSLKKLMCDAQLPLSLRDALPVICDESGIVFVPYIGVRDGMSAQKFEKVTYIKLIEG